MKTICIMKDGRPFWTEVEKYLKFVNARIFSLEYKTYLQEVSGRNPDIIIAGERSFKEVSSITQPVPKLIISEGNIAPPKARDIILLRWPATREAFLEITSRLLYISDRRLFKTVMTIVDKKKDETYLGKSINFSMTGMAFRVDNRQLNAGDILSISFFVPGADERVSINVEVMRSSVNPDDDSVYYGARFIDPDKRTKDILEGFIKKI